ncbi:MAG TPA: hypothetical protein H9884_07265 [Candidatus Yaniella excrementigallinarum]|nr:hypothetical protein [Candidatus Yaniella excrementigallinarum]
MSYQQPPTGPSSPGYNPEHTGPGDQMPRSQGRRRGTRRLIWGIVLMGVGVVGGILGLILFGFSTANQFASFEEDTFEVQSDASVDGLGDNQWFIYQTEDADSTNCQVLDESGQDIVNDSTSSSVETDNFSYEAVQSFRSEPDGTYTIECSDYPVIVGGMAPLGGVAGVLGSILIGFGLFVAGLVLTIIGAVVRSKNKQQVPPSGPLYGGGAYPGYDQGQQPYGPQPPNA